MVLVAEYLLDGAAPGSLVGAIVPHRYRCEPSARIENKNSGVVDYKNQIW